MVLYFNCADPLNGVNGCGHFAARIYVKNDQAKKLSILKLQNGHHTAHGNGSF